MSRTDYKNQKNKELYDQILLNVPKGTKDKLKEVSGIIGISVSDYINRLIKHDLENDHKPEDMVTMLNRWEVQKKYHSMIESASYTKGQGYYIKLKKGFISDYSSTEEIICKSTRELRHVMQYTHPIRTKEEMCGFDSMTYEQLLKWQVPKSQFKNIKSIGDHQINFEDGEEWIFKSVNELRYMWKGKVTE